MEKKSVVFIIPYKSKKSNKILNYIGMTTRRVKEHKQNICKKRPVIAFLRFFFFQAKNIDILFKRPRSIIQVFDFYSRVIFESLEILTQATNCCNDI